MDSLFKKAQAARDSVIDYATKTLESESSYILECQSRLVWLQRELNDGPTSKRMKVLKELIRIEELSIAQSKAAVSWNERFLPVLRSAPLAAEQVGKSQIDHCFGWVDRQYLVYQNGQTRRVFYSGGDGDAGLGISGWSTFFYEDKTPAPAVSWEDMADRAGFPARKLMSGLRTITTVGVVN